LNVQQVRRLANPLTLQWSKVTESVTGYGKERRKGEDEGETEVEKEHKPKWKNDSLKHWVQLTGCFCSLLSGYSFQHPGVVAFPRMKITTEELEHDGHVRGDPNHHYETDQRRL